MDTLVRIERDGDVAIIVLDRPEARNAMNAALAGQTVAAIETCQDAGAIIITGADPAFCAGLDLRDLGVDTLADLPPFNATAAASSVPLVAAVNGPAVTGGFELALACDFIVAAESAQFAAPEIRLGIIPGFGGTQRLPRLLGASRALEMNLVGDPILADEAFELGLANRLVEDHELLDTALHWARKLAGQAPLAVSEIKRVSAAADLDEGIAAEKDAFVRAFTSADAREGIGAFLGKRSPQWKGA